MIKQRIITILIASYVGASNLSAMDTATSTVHAEAQPAITVQAGAHTFKQNPTKSFTLGKRLKSLFIVQDGKAFARLESSLIIASLCSIIFCNLSRITNIFYAKQPLGTLNGHSSSALYSGKLNKTSYEYFSKLTTSDFERLCNKVCAHLTPEEASKTKRFLVQSYNLYHFDAFVDCIRTWPEYKQNIITAHKRIQNDLPFAKYLNSVYGFKRNELRYFIEEEALRLNNN
jgi:hypothetical protein